MKVQFIKIHSDAKLPTKAHEDDAGMDFYAIEDVEIDPHSIQHVKTGLIFQIDWDAECAADYTYYLQLKDKSSIAMQGLHLFAGVVDIGYRGEVTGVMYNARGNQVRSIKKGQKAFQGIIIPIVIYKIEEVEKIVKSERGSGGFGSSGRF